jgi:aminoglycoside phosphotransferase (APT) family kinase protein
LVALENQYRLKLSEYFKAQHLFEEQGQIQDLVKTAQGWETEIYSFGLEHEIDDEAHSKSLILRVYNGDGAEGKSFKEFRVMSKLYEVKFPVPRVYHLETDRSVLGKPFVIMEKVDGQSMAKILGEASDKTIAEYIGLFCRIFVDLHTLDIKPFLADRSIFPDPTIYETSGTYMINMMDQAKTMLGQFKNTSFEQILDWLVDKKGPISEGRLSLIHQDYHFNNILIKGNSQPSVIDWTNFDIADYRLDVAWTLLLISTYSHPEARDYILRTYEEIAGNKVEDIEYFEVIAAARRLFSIYLSLSMGPEKLGMRPEAAEMMKQGDHIKSVIKFLHDRTGITFRGFDSLPT